MPKAVRRSRDTTSTRFLLGTKIRSLPMIGAPPEHRYTNLQLLGSVWNLEAHTQQGAGLAGSNIAQAHPRGLTTRKALLGPSANTLLWCKVKDTLLHGGLLCPFFGVPGFAPKPQTCLDLGGKRDINSDETHTAEKPRKATLICV